MEFKKFILFFVIIFVVSIVNAQTLNENYMVQLDGSYFNNIKIDKPLVWVDFFEYDEFGYRVYHVDSKKDFLPHEFIKLKLFFSVQPDFIKHYTHSQKLEKIYYPSDWNWFSNCSKEFCFGGWVVFNVHNIEKGLGSSTFPIGVDGAQWLNESEYFILNDNIDYYQSNSIFNIINTSYYYFNITYERYYYYDQHDSSITDINSFFNIDLSLRRNLYLLILYFFVAVSLIFFKLKKLSAFMFLCGGFLLIFSGIHLLIALVPIVAAIILSMDS